MVDFIAKAGVLLMGFYLYILAVDIWVSLIDNVDEDYEYCHNCPYGMCFETPGGDGCQKWRDEHEDKGS